MKLRRHLAPIGLSFALLAACGSKEKDADVSATAEAEAAADAESDDTSEDVGGEGAEAAAAANPGGNPDGAAAGPTRPGDRKRDRADKVADGAAGIRERRNERLIRRAGDEATGDGVGSDAKELGDPLGVGPRIIKPQRPALGDRPAPVPEGDADVVAVAPVDNAAEKPAVGALDEVAEPMQMEPAPSGRPQPSSPVVNMPAPEVMRFLPLTVAAEILEQKNLKEQGPLVGIATVSGYNSMHYSTTGDRFGVAVQVWQDGSLRETEDRFRRMRLQYPNAEDVEVLKPVKGFYSGYEAIQSLTFVRPDKQMVVTVSCGEKGCDHGQLLRLARAVQARI